MLLSIIIVSYNTKELLEECLDSVIKSLASSHFKSNQEKILNQVQDDANRNRHPDESQDLPLALTQIPDQVRNDGFQVRHPDSSGRHPDDPPAGGQDLPTEIIIVDNHSTDGTREYLSNIALEQYSNIDKKRKQSKKLNVYKANANERSIPLKVIFNNDNLGFAKANNQGIKIAKGKYIMLLNSDTIVKDGALEILVDYLENHPDTAAVSPLLLNPDNTPQLEYFMRFPNLWQIFFYHNKILRPFCKFVPGLKNKIYIFPQEKPFQSEQLPGAALMARREAFQKVGLLDEDYPFFYEDVDWCYRAKVLKQKLVIVPTAKVVHLKGGSWKKEKKRPADFYQGVFNSLLLFVKKNYGEKEEKKFRRAIKINEFFKFRNFR